MKNKFFLVLLSTFLFTNPALADESFDTKYNEMQNKINEMKNKVLNSKDNFDQNLQISTHSNVQASVLGDGDIQVTNSMPPLPKLPKLSAGLSTANFASPCASEYLSALGGKKVSSNSCGTCSISGLLDQNKLGAVFNPNITNVISDPNDDIVTAMEWNSLGGFMQKIIIEQNPQIELAISDSKKSSELKNKCFGENTQITNEQLNALKYFNN